MKNRERFGMRDWSGLLIVHDLPYQRTIEETEVPRGSVVDDPLRSVMWSYQY